MKVLSTTSVDEALRLGMMYLNSEATIISRDSRAGQVLEAPTPVTTVYKNPTHRVLTCKERDANPFFHFFEALWMLRGDQDVEFLSWFNSKIRQFSDNDVTFHGAYGYRWRHHWEMDQLEDCITLLTRDAQTRRVVLCMWDPVADLGAESRDIPCNDIIFFKRIGFQLRMTICCRSNDAIWGAYGANAVHFSMLMEYVAGRCGLNVGWMTQISDSLHVYTDNPQWETLRHLSIAGPYPYEDGIIKPYPLMNITKAQYWDKDLDHFMLWFRREWNRDDFEGEPDYPYANSFFTDVAQPMAVTWWLHKKKMPGGGLATVREIKASDWCLACEEWLRRREHT